MRKPRSRRSPQRKSATAWRKKTRRNRRQNERTTLLGLERLEDRWVLNADPVLAVVADQFIDEGSLLSLPVIGTFTDVVEGDGSGGGGAIGLDPLNYASLGSFNPLVDVEIDTTTGTISGGFSGTGVEETADLGHGEYKIAVFAFDDFNLDLGITITITGSRPVALLSHSNLVVAGTIDASAEYIVGENPFVADVPGPGGGAGGIGGSMNGKPATGAPELSGGQLGAASSSGGASGSGGGAGGIGGHGEVDVFGVGMFPRGNDPGGIAFADLETAVHGGSGGSAGGRLASSGHFILGGAGGGGIELGAVDTVSILSTGQVLADGSKGRDGFLGGTGGGGGAGGGILVHATNVVHEGLLSAEGGRGGSGHHLGGGGGGGEILIAYNDGAGSFAGSGAMSVAAGGLAIGTTVSSPGAGGNISIIAQAPAAVPVIESFDFIIDWGDDSPPVTGPATIDTPGVNIGDIVEGSFGGSHTYDDNGVYLVTVTVNDSRGGSDTKTFQTTVANVAPTAVLSNSGPVDEGSPASVSFSDPFDPSSADTAAGFRYAYDFGNNGVWDVGDGSYAGSATEISQAVPAGLLADGPAQVVVRGRIIDKDDGFTDYTTVVDVLNVPPTAEDAVFEVVENRPNGTVVGTVVATDPGDDILTFTILGGTGETAFAIDEATGEISVADSSQLDFETTASFELVVEVSDGDGGFDTALITIDLLNQPSIHGAVFLDVNQNGVFDANEPGLEGVVIQLLDEHGDAVLDELGEAIVAVTTTGGYFLFEDIDPGTYQVFKEQLSGVTAGDAFLGDLGGIVLANDRIQLTLERTDAWDYAFSELGQQLSSGDAAGIGFWQNKHGQSLIAQGGTQLADWLTATFPNIFGNTFVGASGNDVAQFYRDQLFRQQGKKMAGPAKVDAQFMAVALATFFTSRQLAGEVAGSFGFHVTDTGIGTKIVNVGDKGAAFDTDDGSDLTILQLLQATNSLTNQTSSQSGFAAIYDIDGDGQIDAYEASLRTMANSVYTSINEAGGI